MNPAVVDPELVSIENNGDDMKNGANASGNGVVNAVKGTA